MEGLVNTAVLENTFQGKKVFLTGHTGFKGSWLVACLKKLGAEITGYALDPENKKNLFDLIEGHSLCHSIIHDIRDKEFLREQLLNCQPDFIFHLAAQPLVRLSYQMPAETFEVNTLGTAYLLDALRFLDKPCSTVIITTDKVYQNKEWVFPYRETDRLGGHDPYSASKAAAEIITDSFKSSFFPESKFNTHGKAIATARAGNVIGGGDWSKDRIIPDIITALEKLETIPVRNPDAIRPWQHVLEPVYGYMLLAAALSTEPKKFSGAWNFGPFPGDTFTVKELVQKAIACWGTGKYEIIDQSGQPHEAGLLKLDISKSLNELCWKPAMNSGTSIQWAINWYKQKPADSKTYTFSQIEEYFAL